MNYVQRFSIRVIGNRKWNDTRRFMIGMPMAKRLKRPGAKVV